MSKSTCCLFPLWVNVEFTSGKFQFYSGQTHSLVGVNSQFTYGNAPFCRTFPSKCGQDTDQLKQLDFFACVYRFSTTAKKELSTESANEEKKCLVKYQ